jgi:isopentenyl-diphosphate delta-isomerase
VISELSVPVIIKETGCGMSRALGQRLRALGGEWVDVSGAGGTSWVAVEALRADGLAAKLGDTFRDWGIPTAASLCQLSGLGLKSIATGGIRHGLDVARAIMLGASAVGVARPFLKAWREAGDEGVEALLTELVAGLKVAMLLTGSRTLADLQKQPLVVGPSLARWIVRDTPLALQCQAL